MSATVSAKIQAEGMGAFKSAMKDGEAAVRNLDAQLKLLDSKFRAGANASDVFAKKQELLKQKLREEQSAVAQISQKLEDMALAGDQGSRAFTNLERDLAKHKRAEVDVQTEIDKTVAAFNDLSNGARDAGSGVSDAAEEVESAGNAFDAGFAQKIARSVVRVQSYLEIAKKVGSAFINIAKGAVSYNAEIESYEKTITAFFETSGQGSAEAATNAQKLIANQRELSKVTGVSTNNLIDANKMLIASGVSGERAQEAITGLSKAIVATGGGSEELSRMAQNLQQISNVGKASTQDMKQFAMAGVDVYSLIAEQTGLSVSQLKEMDITFDMVVDALTAATSEGGKFFEASQVGAQTLNGQMNILNSTIQEKLGQAFEPVNKALTEKVLPAAIDFVEGVNWDAVGSALAGVATAMGDVVETITSAIGWYEETFGQPAVESIDATKIATEDLGNAFLSNAGAIEFYDGAVTEAFIDMSAGGKRMATEVDGSLSDVSQSALREGNMARLNWEQGYNSGKSMSDLTKEAAGQAKQVLIDYGWEAMANGETNALMYAEGWQEGTPTYETILADLVEKGRQKLQTDESETWGAHMMDGFDRGIASRENSIIGRISNFAGRIASYLEFTRPDKGPLHNYEQWMPHFMEGMAKGISQNAYLVERQAQKLANSMAVQMTTSMAVVNSAPNYNSFTINQAPGQSPRALVREINKQLGGVYGY